MLVRLHTGYVGQIERIAGFCHCQRQRQRLTVGHTLNADRHQQRGRLIIGKAAIHHAVYKGADLRFAQLAAEALFSNNITGIQHNSRPP